MLPPAHRHRPALRLVKAAKTCQNLLVSIVYVNVSTSYSYTVHSGNACRKNSRVGDSDGRRVESTQVQGL